MKQTIDTTLDASRAYTRDELMALCDAWFEQEGLEPRSVDEYIGWNDEITKAQSDWAFLFCQLWEQMQRAEDDAL